MKKTLTVDVCDASREEYFGDDRDVQGIERIGWYLLKQTNLPEFINSFFIR